MGLLRRDKVQIGRDVARPLIWISAAEGPAAVSDVDGLVQDGADVVGAEPGGELADGRRVGVVEMMARGEDFDRHGPARARAGGLESVQQAGVQAVREEYVGRESGLLGVFLRYSSGAWGVEWF